MVELLAPAGSLESLYAAVNAGADAVYIGGSMFGARAYADNPDEDALKQGIDFCHLRGKKVYLTVNTLLKSQELETKLYSFLLPYYECGVDGLIVQDVGVVQFVHKHFPGLDVHASTQMTVTSAYGAHFLQKTGVTRVVPARELSIQEIRYIIDETGVEVETFIHGAMCYCYSGQCLLSSMIGGRSGNRGRCAQPCRLPYERTDLRKPSSYLLSMKDMCTLEHLPEILKAGIASLKIEGRMKRPEYTAGVVSIYRKYIDLYLKKGKNGYRVQEQDKQILMDLYNRGGFSGGYYHQKNGKEMMTFHRPNHQGTEAARVKSIQRDEWKVTALEDLHRQDVLELSPGNEITLSDEQKTGSTFTIRAGKSKGKPGNVIFRTKNERLLKEIADAYILKNSKEKIKGILRISGDKPAILELSCKDVKVSVEADIAQPAQNQAATAESVRKQMEKTGNTPFVFESLLVEIDDRLFIPVKGLNELRRLGLSRLEQAILASNHRQLPELSEAKSGAYQSVTDVPGTRLTILVTTEEQLLRVLDHSEQMQTNIDTIYLDSFFFGLPEELKKNQEHLEKRIKQIRTRGIRCFFSFPPVFRSKDQAFVQHPVMEALMQRMDGFLLHTLDQFAYADMLIKKYGLKAELAADESLYAYNSEAERFWRKYGIGRMTFPSELNFRELQGLGRADAELNVYGHQALMQSAQCITKNTTGCTGVPQILYLKDRKNAAFPVLNRCSVCCNTIYNSVPLQLAGCRKDLEQLQLSYARLTFTIERAQEVELVLDQYEKALFTEVYDTEIKLDGTRGHFRRGVE